MKRVFLVRHAKSSWKDPALPDLERPLNKRGERDAPIVASWLAAIIRYPAFYVSSPALRARATAIQFCLAAGLTPESLNIHQSLYFQGEDAIIRLIHTLPEMYDTAVLFSHNPELTWLANRFSEEVIENVPTCGVFELVNPADSWALFGDSNTSFGRFMTPKKLRHS